MDVGNEEEIRRGGDGWVRRSSGPDTDALGDSRECGGVSCAALCSGQDLMNTNHTPPASDPIICPG